jgi:hypothetical protein
MLRASQRLHHIHPDLLLSLPRVLIEKLFIQQPHPFSNPNTPRYPYMHAMPLILTLHHDSLSMRSLCLATDSSLPWLVCQVHATVAHHDFWRNAWLASASETAAGRAASRRPLQQPLVEPVGADVVQVLRGRERRQIAAAAGKTSCGGCAASCRSGRPSWEQARGPTCSKSASEPWRPCATSCTGGNQHTVSRREPTCKQRAVQRRARGHPRGRRQRTPYLRQLRRNTQGGAPQAARLP